MNHSFKTWLHRRRRCLVELAPEADKVLPLVAGAGTNGITRRQLGHTLDLDREIVDALLDCLAWENGVPVFRTRPPKNFSISLRYERSLALFALRRCIGHFNRR
jgi:hypothetical protein